MMRSATQTVTMGPGPEDDMSHEVGLINPVKNADGVYGDPALRDELFDEAARQEIELAIDAENRKLQRIDSLRLEAALDSDSSGSNSDNEPDTLLAGPEPLSTKKPEKELKDLKKRTAQEEVILQKRLDLLESQIKLLTKKPVAPENNGKEDDTLRQRSGIQKIPNEQWRIFKPSNKIYPKLNALLVTSRASKRKKDGMNTPADKPFKLALNSQELINWLNSFTGDYISSEQNVLIRPFKFLLYNRKEVLLAAKKSEEMVKTAEKTVSSVPPGAPGGERKAAEKVLREKIKVRNEMQALVHFMEEDMKDIWEMKAVIESCSVSSIEFQNAWMLFKPGDWIFHRDDLKEYRNGNEGKLQAYRVMHITGGQEIIDTRGKSRFFAQWDRSFDSSSERESRVREDIRHHTKFSTLIIDCLYVECDGSRYGAKTCRFAIPSYTGSRDITSLPLVSQHYVKDFEQIRAKLVARGRKFLDIAPGKHMRYKGPTLRERREVARNYHNFHVPPEEIDTEIMVDQAYGINAFMKKLDHRNWSSTIRLGGNLLKAPTTTDTREHFDVLPIKDGDNWLSDGYDDSVLEAGRRNAFMNTTELLENYSLKSNPPDDFVALLPSKVYGYAFANRKWFPFNIELIEEVDINKRKADSSYDDLVLPSNHKKLLQALIKNQVDYQDKATQQEFSVDIVKGKGKGIIILLHGVPGVGKTSTAECIAAQLNRPLLPITCGDLGITAHETANALETYCDLAYRWRCVLLLDEADVFLAQREKGDIKRNALVSVFLRTLEYYSGVLLLTTNRVGEFDEAFRSRIHISLYYPKLKPNTTERIWINNIERIKRSQVDVDIEEEAIHEFAKWHWEVNECQPSRRWNGRQIKNAFQTALALANWDFYDGGKRELEKLKRPLVKAEHFMKIAETSAHFDDYITDVFGVDNSEDPFSIMAERRELRKDDYAGPGGGWGSGMKGRGSKNGMRGGYGGLGGGLGGSGGGRGGRGGTSFGYSHGYGKNGSPSRGGMRRLGGGRRDYEEEDPEFADSEENEEEQEEYEEGDDEIMETRRRLKELERKAASKGKNSKPQASAKSSGFYSRSRQDRDGEMEDWN